MNVIMKKRDKALSGGLGTDRTQSGWVRGWGVVKGPPSGRHFAGIFATRGEAEAAAREAGPGFEPRWGSFDRENSDYITGGR